MLLTKHTLNGYVPSPDCASAMIDSVSSPTAHTRRLSPLRAVHYEMPQLKLAHGSWRM
jgi:hypothetical protein